MMSRTELSNNVVKIKRLLVTFQNLQINDFDIPKFRGYLARRYSSFDLIHNHLDNNRLRYAYPSIQFKTTNSQPIIVAIGEGIDIMKRVFLDIDELRIEERTYTIDERSVILQDVELGKTSNMHQYQFISPWMALNTENHKKYKSLGWHERRGFLERVLAGNLKSLSKGCNYFIPDFSSLHVQVELRPVSRNFKNIKRNWRKNGKVPMDTGCVTFTKTANPFCGVG